MTKIKSIIENTDCISFMQELDDGSVDLTVTSPPIRQPQNPLNGIGMYSARLLIIYIILQ